MTNTETTAEAVERPADIVDQLVDAGVDRDLARKVFDCIESERAKAIAKAARLFYSRPDDNGPISLGDFSDQFNNMSRRLWGLVAAVGDLVDGYEGPLSCGVLQLAEDAANEMERLAESFKAERWLARKPEAGS